MVASLTPIADGGADDYSRYLNSIIKSPLYLDHLWLDFFLETQL